jgi:hypothetical protein
MDRKWRLNRGAHETVESPVDFKRKYVLTERDDRDASSSESRLQSLVDVYALYTVLHIENRPWKLRWSGRHGVYYFITEKLADGEGQGITGADLAHIGEGSGDESDGVDGENCASGDESDGNRDARNPGKDDHDGKGDGQGDVPDTKTTVYCNVPAATDGDAGAVNGAQVLVPVSSGTRALTPRVMHSLCELGKGVAQQVLLSVVDSNGTVTRCCLYDYVQGPLASRGVEATLAT